MTSMASRGSAAMADGSAGGLRLDGRVVDRQHLANSTRDAMFRLLTSHFRGVDRRTFEDDLVDKHCAILLEDECGTLRGFSTMRLYRSDAPGRRVSVVYSGDTIVERGWWGSAALPRMWIRAVRQLASTVAGDDLFWLLLTSGYRTYRFLPVFFRTFYPSYDEVGAAELREPLAALAAERFGERYEESSGIVRFPRPQVLVPELLMLPEGRTADPHVAYFLARNPGHVQGDELACLARIRDDNLTAAGRRMTRDAGGMQG